MTNFKWHIAAFFAIFASILAANVSPVHSATIGAQIDNIATVSFQNGFVPVTITTAPASFTVEARRTPSTIEFFRVSPNAPDGISVSLNGSFFSPSGGAVPDDFIPVGAAINTGGAVVDVSAPVTIAPAASFFTGELIIVRVLDAGQNGDPSTIETINAVVTSGTGDTVTLQLFESGPDTGEFLAYLPSIGGAATQDDPQLSVDQAFALNATYQDPFVATDISTDAAGVDPFGRLFDSVTGALINGAEVTIVDAITGNPAQVYGIDGVSAYPSTIITGGTVTDASGLVYDLEDGEFLFPIMFPGEYRLVIVPPPGFSAPSTALPASFTTLPNAPFTIIEASFGDTFILDGTGDVSFDVPLDPFSEIILTKQASTQTGAIGDFVRYAIDIQNTGEATSLNIQDQLPIGFRYQSNTARLNGLAINDPAISADGQTLTFTPGTIAAGQTSQLSYVTEIAAGTPLGDAVNTAVGVSATGIEVTNRTEVGVFIQEDLLRSRLTIVGRVAENACNIDQPWPRKIEGGKGVPGVRLYMETGAYVVSDEDGLFHFEDVEARTHVVQIDETTIPDGYTPVLCEENTRRAGSAISQFVDAQGGAVWRANFYLQNNNPAAPEDARADDKSDQSGASAYLQFDKNWLNQQAPGLEWAYPNDAALPSSKSVNLGLKHDVKTVVHLFLNGDKISGRNFSGREVDDTRTIALSRWRGVDLRDGENVFEAVIFNQQGAEIDRITKTITFVTDVTRAQYLPDQSKLAANGTTPPAIAVRLTNDAGQPVHAGRIVSIEIEPPYRAKSTGLIEDLQPLTAPLSTSSTVTVGEDGVAVIELEPTVRTGKARIRVILDDSRAEEISALLKPALRDWIVVGLAEGGGSLDRDTGSGGGSTGNARDLIGKGRIAFFAKGVVKENWLVTVAADTAKGRGDQDDELFDVIDPDARFPLYGDRSVQEFEAQSRFPVYAKVENGGFRGEFGDYDTGFSDSKLGRYSRRLSGLKADYENDRFIFSGFAAETNQDFIKDEFAADGTSGPFTLTTAPLVRNSEVITIETRDRFRPDIIRNVQPLTRFIDYDIDFVTGEIVFRLPIPGAADANSINVIVADYETFAPVTRDLTAGGRAAVKLADGRVELGGTIIHEEGRASAPGGKSNLFAVDLRVDVTDTTRLRLEYGTSQRETDGNRESGDAILAEVEHRSRNLSASAFYADTDQGFGLNQQTSAVEGIRRFGAEASYRIDSFVNPKTNQIGERFVDGRVLREENLETGASRTITEVGVRQESATTSGSLGLRRVVENLPDAEQSRTLLARATAQQRFEKIGLTVHGSRDQVISGDGNSTLFPQRTIVGLDQKILPGLSLNASHEIQNGDNASSANTIVGVSAQPWAGSNITASSDLVTQDSGRNIGATLGIDQQVQFSPKWSGAFGITRRQQLASDGVIDPVDTIVPDDALSPLEVDENFTSLFVGAGYSDAVSTGSARFEVRKSTAGQRYTSVLGAAREISEVLSFAGAARVEQENNDLTPDRRSIDARLGTAWRPRGDAKLIAFNRFDIKADTVDGEFSSWKAINNLALNAKISERTEVSLNHGFKYSAFDADGISNNGITQLVGLEGRFDVTKNIDIGLQGSALFSHNSGTAEYSFGPSIGISPLQNFWITAGWNIEGFKDDDFVAAEFTREGPYIQLRIKFDQHTAKGLLDKLSLQ